MNDATHGQHLHSFPEIADVVEQWPAAVERSNLAMAKKRIINVEEFRQL